MLSTGVSVQSSSSIPPAHVSRSALSFLSSGISAIAFPPRPPPFAGYTCHVSGVSSQDTSKVVARDDLNSPLLVYCLWFAGLWAFSMLRTIFEAECALSSTEGILGKEQPLEVLKTSVLNHIPTGWTLRVCVSVCVERVCMCAPPVRDFTINHILCDFACFLSRLFSCHFSAFATAIWCTVMDYVIDSWCLINVFPSIRPRLLLLNGGCSLPSPVESVEGVFREFYLMCP